MEKRDFGVNSPADSNMADPTLFFVISVPCWCMSLLQLLGIYLFNKLRGLPIIEKRYPRLVMLEAIVCAIVLVFIYPAWMAVTYNYPDIPGEWWPWTSGAFLYYTYQIAPVSGTCRIWLISYDLHYLNSCKNQQWKTEIDVSYAERDWYLKNRGRWGNRQFVVRLGFLYYIIASTAVFGLLVLQWTFDLNVIFVFALQAMFYFVHMAMPLYLYITTPRKLQDQFLFQYVE